jgi:hypothetical protein
MKFNIQKMMDIKNPKDLENYNPNKPIFYKNYLFHYLIIFDKLDLLKINKHPVFQFNEDNLDGFMLAAKYDNMTILKYLIKNYPDYVQNHNSEGLNFINYIAEPKKIIKIIKDFPDVNWEYLLKFKNEKNIDFYRFIISQLDVEDIKWFISKYKFNSYYTLSAILLNEKLNDSKKIKIFDKFNDKEINNKNFENQGLIMDLINSENSKLTEYFVKRNIDLEYIIKPNTIFISPFFYLYSKIITSAKTKNFKKMEEILEIIWKKIKLDYKYMNKDGVNYVQLVLKFDCSDCKSKILNTIVDEILTNSPDESWTHVNLKKDTALFELVKYPIEKYFKYVKNRKLNVSQKNDQGLTVLDIAPEKWANELKKLDNFKLDNTIKLNLEKYQHQTKFTATMMDIIIYFIYLSNKYKNLYIPKIFNPTDVREDYPWVINYEKDKIDIYPNLNMVINNVRREKKYDYALLFLGQTLDNDLKHANIILYDFKNLTIERFEPYGDDGIESEVDDILDEELTWNTGMKYLRPNDYLPRPGYQLLSNENDIYNQKVGDFGGFCLGWCIWYVEHRIKNSKIDSITLNKKTLEKMLRLDDSLNEFIRNYSNKLFDEKYKILKNICPDNNCIKEKAISNLVLSSEEQDKIFNYADKFFGLTNE